ncbi:hypothetical protein MMC26_002304 [Xylographa opegraphella]|nr:hypothetical protein [Xylographa opegraphella]
MKVSIIAAVLSTAAFAHAENVPRAWGLKATRTQSVSLTAAATAVNAAPTVALNATVVNCFVTLPANPLSAEGLATPFILQPPCSQSVNGQQSFAEAAILDPATGALSIYHPLIIDAGTTPLAPNVVPNLPPNAMMALWFGFNGGVLQLQDANGLTTNTSPTLKNANCVNGLPGVAGDVFGQVSWCNAQAFFAAANKAIAAGLTVIPPLGTDTLGNPCPTSRSFEITDACPSDNVPTQYLLNPVTRQTSQDTVANRAANANATVINNASDEALLASIIDPLIGCTPFQAPSLDNPGVMSSALALSEIQANQLQAAPIGLVPLNDPDCLLTGAGTVSPQKTNAYRLGVNQPILSGNAAATVDPTGVTGALVPYCNNMVAGGPPFFAGFQNVFINQGTPAANVGNNLFTFLCERYLMSLTQLGCPPAAFQPVVCQVDGNGAATSCVITLNGTTTTNTTGTAMPSGIAAAPVTTSTVATTNTGFHHGWGHRHRKNKY